MSSEPQYKSQTIRTEPHRNVIVDPERSIVPADFVKAAVETGLNLCTLIFYRTKYNTKQVEMGIRLDSIDTEDFLEVKIPTNAVWDLVLYLNDLYQQLRAKPEENTIFFGPCETKPEPKQN